jgi:uncharacterized protein (DUF433 family)
MTDDQLLERITMNAEILCGKPVIQGTRLSVEFILNLLAHDMSWDEILREYPGLTVNDIQACLLFARNTVAQGV